MSKLACTNPVSDDVSSILESQGTETVPAASKKEGRRMNAEIRSTVVSWIALFGYVTLCGLLWAAS
jgi:hypothetical protein